MGILLKAQGGRCAGCREPLGAIYGLRYIEPAEPGKVPNYNEDNVQLVHTQCGNVSRKHDRARKARQLSRAGMKPKEIAEMLEVSLRSVGRYLKDFSEPTSRKLRGGEDRPEVGYVEQESSEPNGNIKS